MKLTAIVLTHNSEAVLADCLRSLEFADEVLVIDDNSADQTVKLALSFQARVVSRRLVSFAGQRNWAAKQVKTDWFFMVDSDERAPLPLAREIKQTIRSGQNSAYRVKRLNHFFGKKVTHGGYWPDWQTRLFRRRDFSGYFGKIHESAKFKGKLGSLSKHLEHFSHRTMSDCLEKSAAWTPLEAEAFIRAGHPPVTWWRILKVMVWEFNYRYFKKLGFLDGYIGLAESLYQAMNRFFVYQQIWEKQQQ